MIHRFITTDDIIAEIIDEFNIKFEGSKDRLHRWILQCCDIIGAANYYNNTFKHEKVVNWEAPLPCDLKHLEKITIGDNVLYLSSAVTSRNNNLVLDNPSNNVTILHNKVRFPFKEINNNGFVTFYYQGVPFINNAYWVPDDSLYKEAIKWYVVKIHLLRGAKHPVISFERADAEFKDIKDSARNSINALSKLEFERLKMNFDLITFDSHFTDTNFNNN